MGEKSKDLILRIEPIFEAWEIDEPSSRSGYSMGYSFQVRCMLGVGGQKCVKFPLKNTSVTRAQPILNFFVFRLCMKLSMVSPDEWRNTPSSPALTLPAIYWIPALVSLIASDLSDISVLPNDIHTMLHVH